MVDLLCSTDNSFDKQKILFDYQIYKNNYKTSFIRDNEVTNQKEQKRMVYCVEQRFKKVFQKKFTHVKISSQNESFLIFQTCMVSILDQKLVTKILILLPFYYSSQNYLLTQTNFYIYDSPNLYIFNLKRDQKITAQYSIIQVYQTIYDIRKEITVVGDVISMYEYNNTPIIATTKHIQFGEQTVFNIGYACKTDQQYINKCITYKHFVIILATFDFIPFLIISDLNKPFDFQIFTKDSLLLLYGNYRTLIVASLFTQDMQAKMDEAFVLNCSVMEIFNEVIYIGFFNCSSIIEIYVDDELLESSFLMSCSKQTYQTLQLMQNEISLINIKFPGPFIYTFPQLEVRQLQINNHYIIAAVHMQRTFEQSKYQQNMIYVFDKISKVVNQVILLDDNESVKQMQFISQFEVLFSTSKNSFILDCLDSSFQTLNELQAVGTECDLLCSNENETIDILSRTFIQPHVQIHPLTKIIQNEISEQKVVIFKCQNEFAQEMAQKLENDRTIKIVLNQQNSLLLKGTHKNIIDIYLQNMCKQSQSICIKELEKYSINDEQFEQLMRNKLIELESDVSLQQVDQVPAVSSLRLLRGSTIRQYYDAFPTYTLRMIQQKSEGSQSVVHCYEHLEGNQFEILNENTLECGSEYVLTKLQRMQKTALEQPSSELLEPEEEEEYYSCFSEQSKSDVSEKHVEIIFAKEDKALALKKHQAFINSYFDTKIQVMNVPYLLKVDQLVFLNSDLLHLNIQMLQNISAIPKHLKPLAQQQVQSGFYTVVSHILHRISKDIYAFLIGLKDKNSNCITTMYFPFLRSFQNSSCILHSTGGIIPIFVLQDEIDQLQNHENIKITEKYMHIQDLQILNNNEIDLLFADAEKIIDIKNRGSKLSQIINDVKDILNESSNSSSNEYLSQSEYVPEEEYEEVSVKKEERLQDSRVSKTNIILTSTQQYIQQQVIQKFKLVDEALIIKETNTCIISPQYIKNVLDQFYLILYGKHYFENIIVDIIRSIKGDKFKIDEDSLLYNQTTSFFYRIFSSQQYIIAKDLISLFQKQVIEKSQNSYSELSNQLDIYEKFTNKLIENLSESELKELTTAQYSDEKRMSEPLLLTEIDLHSDQQTQQKIQLIQYSFAQKLHVECYNSHILCLLMLLKIIQQFSNKHPNYMHELLFENDFNILHLCVLIFTKIVQSPLEIVNYLEQLKQFKQDNELSTFFSRVQQQFVTDYNREFDNKIDFKAFQETRRLAQAKKEVQVIDQYSQSYSYNEYAYYSDDNSEYD